MVPANEKPVIAVTIEAYESMYPLLVQLARKEVEQARKNLDRKLDEMRATNAKLCRRVGCYRKANRKLRNEVEAVEAEISDNLELVRDGAETKTLDVVDRYDYTDGVVRTVWAGEVVVTRPITHDERQQGLKFVDKRDKQKAEEDAKTEAAKTEAEEATGFVNTAEQTTEGPQASA